MMASERVDFRNPISQELHEALSPEAIKFAVDLHREFSPQIKVLLEERKIKQQEIDSGIFPDFLPETEGIRNGEWQVEPIPDDLKKRWVEITGPVDRKMMINALNSGANVFMADFEDSLSPTWQNILEGQQNLSDAVKGTIQYTSPEGKEYRLGDKPAVLFVRPRGLHLKEENVMVDGEPISASLFDFGVYFFNNARRLIENRCGPYFYLPKLQNHQEAKLWNSVFVKAQDTLGIPQGTIKATVLIEHILAAFEMNEILYELREHSAGLNAGRWDYLFSIIKTFSKNPGFILPNRAEITMDKHMMIAYDRLLVETCHKRGIHAIGGMSAYIPVKDVGANARAFESVAKDKERELINGHDGAWVAHPGLVPLVKSIFEKGLDGKENQIEEYFETNTTANDLLTVPEGFITEEGIRTNIRVFLLYLESWLNGQGAVPINNLMEDAATAEISRTQLWQWQHHQVMLFDKRILTSDLLRKIVDDEFRKITDQRKGQSSTTLDIAEHMLYSDFLDKSRFVEFLTIPAYQVLKK